MSDRIGSSRTPDLAEVFSTIMEKRLADLHVAMPAVVTKFDKTKQTITAKPLLRNTIIFEDGEEESEELPEFPEVPVVYPRGGGYFLAFPLEKGDNVLLLFNERSIDKFVFSTGKAAVDPVDLRKHDLSDAVAIPGFAPITRALKEDLSGGVFGKEKDAQLRARGSTIEVTTGGAPAAVTGFVAMATLVAAELSSIATALSTHVHSGVTTGPGVSGTAVPVYVPGTVASTNLKAD